MLDENMTKWIIANEYNNKKKELDNQIQMLREYASEDMGYMNFVEEINNSVSIDNCLHEIRRLSAQMHAIKHLYEDGLRLGEIEDSKKV